MWWPSTDTVCFDGANLPVWYDTTATYLSQARRPPLTPEKVALACGYVARSEGLEPPTF